MELKKIYGVRNQGLTIIYRHIQALCSLWQSHFILFYFIFGNHILEKHFITWENVKQKCKATYKTVCAL